MHYYDRMLLWKQERLHFNTLPLDEFKKGNFFTTEQLRETCSAYLQEILSLYFLEDYPSQNLKKPLSIDDTKNFDSDRREGCIQNTIFGTKSGESLLSAYQRKINDILILHPGTLPEVKATLLKTRGELVNLLLREKNMMEEDDLDSFFKQLKKELPPNPAEYLRESLEKATIDFDEMRKQDVQFNSGFKRIPADDIGYPLDYQYQNLWNKQVAGWIRTPEEHNQIIDTIVGVLTMEDIRLIRQNINRFHGIVGKKVDVKYNALKGQII